MRFTGSDKPASRYLEATIGVQPEANFHYRPLWARDREIYDTRNTAIIMRDWYRLLDPRQYYYGAWTIARSRQQDAAERNFAFVGKHDLLATLVPELRDAVADLVLPLRHLEYAANLNNCYMSAYGYGVSVTQATMMCAMDRLGIAQYVTRIGLILDGSSGDALRAARAAWQTSPTWQPLRELAENMLVVHDWFELFVAQNVVLDSLVYGLVYGSFGERVARQGLTFFAMLTEFMSEWFVEHVRWTDAVIKVAAAESDANKAQLGVWKRTWLPRASIALRPLATSALGADADAALALAAERLETRLETIDVH
ncbi:MAG TPA: aromatic/alkene monooxygenase hydroxylase subunit beta [Kofleriaceae bacterium]